MTEAQVDETGSPEQGAQAGEQGQVPDGGSGTPPAEQMARKLVRDVAAFEVDPPPPARADATARDAARDSARPDPAE